MPGRIDEDDTPLDGMEWPSVNVHGIRQSRVVWPKGTSGNSTRIQASNASVSNRTLPADLGPCLYLGPAGQRCDRRATRDGFCQRHQPDAPTASTPLFTPKKLAAFFIALAMLWPEITRFLSALARLLR